MKADTILQAALLDIIFENRNKSYGAYPLRKHYGERIYHSLGIILMITALFSGYSLLQKNNFQAGAYNIKDVVMASAAKVIEPEKKPELLHEKKPKSKLPVSRGFMIVDSSQLTDPILHRDSAAFDAGMKPFDDGTGGPLPPGEPLNLSGKGPAIKLPLPPTPPPIAADIPFTVVDIMPSFPGGDQALLKFLKRNLLPPDDVIIEKTVSVKVKFIVGYDGSLKGFEVVEDGGELFNKEVMRVLKKMPAWIPGVARGKNVSVYYTIPVKFVAQE